LPAAARPAPAVPRRKRVEALLRAKLATALGRLEDPRLGHVAVTRVEMTDDLLFARVFVHAGLGTEQRNGAPEDILRGLRAASGRLRRQLGAALALRYTPALRFLYDDGLDAARRVDELLDEIKREEQDRG
jgi:ribosome-binding factor A